MEDVYDDYFIIRNMNLRQCNQGQLFADVELIRGIRDYYGDFTYERGEKMYNVEIGSIGCDPSCGICNGTQPYNC